MEVKRMTGATPARNGGGGADDEKWLDPGYILKEQSAGFSQTLDMGSERKCGEEGAKVWGEQMVEWSCCQASGRRLWAEKIWREDEGPSWGRLSLQGLLGI